MYGLRMLNILYVRLLLKIMIYIYSLVFMAKAKF